MENNKGTKPISHYTKWFKNDKTGNVKPSRNLEIGEGLAFMQNLKGFNNTKCKQTIDEIIKKDLFFKLCMVPHQGDITEEMKKTNSSLSLFKLLLYALKYLKGAYWTLTWGGDLLNDVLELTKCLVKLSNRKFKFSKETYIILFENFKKSDILQYTSSYDIVLGTNKSLNLINEIAFEKERIDKNKNNDNEYGIYKSGVEKDKYVEILGNLETFYNNVQEVINRSKMSNISLQFSKSQKSKTNSNRAIIKGTIKIIGNNSQHKSNKSKTRSNKSSERSPHDAYFAIDDAFKILFGKKKS